MRAIPAFAVLASVALAEALPPFVVLSKARSGTTWFLELLRQHPQVRVEGEILFGASTSAEATARLEAFGREKRRGAAHVAVGFKLLDGQGGEALRDGAGNGTVAAWLERRRAKLLVLEREGLARLVSMRKHEAAVRDFDALLAAGALRSKNEKYKCFSADCVLAVKHDAHWPDLRFKIGDRVYALVDDGWQPGKILKVKDHGKPYRIELEDAEKTNVWAPVDDDEVIKQRE